MGFLDKVFKKGENEGTTGGGKVSLSKEETINRVNLAKEEVHKVCLSKEPLNNLTSRVGIVLDYSGSMAKLYKNGTVQSVLEKAFPIALEFDDNGAMEVWIFENGYRRLPDMTIDNVYGYVKREILDKKYSMGGTNYAPVMRDVIKKYTEEDKASVPSYVVFITDGDNWDKKETDSAIKDASKLPIFWQFIGVGNAGFDYLQALDDMKGRYVDNADFFSVGKIDSITYNNMLNEFPGWLSDPKVKGMLK